MKKYNYKFSSFVFVLISILSFYFLIYNLFHFNPILGYDAEAHIMYVDYFSRYLPNEFRLPDKSETREYFNPPIGYLVPSIAQVFCRNIIESSNFLSECQPIYGSNKYFNHYCISQYTNLYIKNFYCDTFLNAGYLLLFHY